MAFWGIEVRPGKPYTHCYDNARGRLRVCQATLGNGKGTMRSVVQCNVGNNSPILICSLIPNSSETCHLELEFEEEDEVIFSVIGQRSVHLSGYYTGSGRINDGDDEDSYGEDIAETDSDASESFDVGGSEDDEYESDFIDDDNIEMFSASAPRKSGVVIEEIIEDDKPSNGNGTHRRLRKKHQVSDTEDGDDDSQQQLVVKPAAPAVVESEDEDGFPLSFSASKKKTGRNVGTVKELSEKTDDKDRKRKIDAISQDSASERDKLQPSDSNTPSLVDAENTGKKKKKIKDKRPLETGSNMDGKEDIAVGGEEVVSANGVKSNKKKKEKAEKGKALESRAESLAEGTDTEAKGDAKEAGNTNTVNEDNFAEAEKLPDNKDEKSSQKSNKKKSELVKEDISREQGGSLAKTADERNQLASGEKTNRYGYGDTNTTRYGYGDTNTTRCGYGDTTIPNTSRIQYSGVTGSSANGTQQETKKMKKESKNHDKDLSHTQEPANQVEAEDRKQPRDTRTFDNGLIIEELSMGKPNGKRAIPGTRVLITYVGKFQNGETFDSNVGKPPMSFRLGLRHVIKGLDIGVSGMRVGDKRRVTVPPAMGYGDKQVGHIPANSWLFFDIELIDVRKVRSRNVS